MRICASSPNFYVFFPGTVLHSWSFTLSLVSSPRNSSTYQLPCSLHIFISGFGFFLASCMECMPLLVFLLYTSHNRSTSIMFIAALIPSFNLTNPLMAARNTIIEFWHDADVQVDHLDRFSRKNYLGPNVMRARQIAKRP